MKRLKLFDIIVIAAVVCCVLAYSAAAHDWNALAIIASVSGIFNVVLAAEGLLLNFFFGAVTVAGYACIAYMADNYATCCLHVLYLLPMQLVGYIQWKKAGATLFSSSSSNAPVKPRHLSWRVRLVISVGCVLAIILLALLLKQIGGAAPWADSSTTVLYIVGQALMSLAITEQYYVWIVVNASGILLWVENYMDGKAGAIPMIIMWLSYLVVAVYGVRVWKSLESGR